MKISAKFLNMRISLVDRRVPSESTTGLANLPTHCADPGTDGCGLHKNGGGKATARRPEAMVRGMKSWKARAREPESDGESVTHHTRNSESRLWTPDPKDLVQPRARCV